MVKMTWMLASLVTVVVTVDSAELVKLIRMSESQLRERFDLPATCEPALSATRQGPRKSIEVRIQCLEAHRGTSRTTAPIQRPAGR
jgi:hypothetical protein